jgi:TolB protein
VHHPPSHRPHRLAAAITTAAGLAAAVALTLLGAPPAAAAAAPAPTGRMLVIDDRPGEGVKSILATCADLRRLNLQIPFYGHPDYSPDGSRITYADGWSVYTARADGTDRQWVAGAGYVPSHPRWSPDGTEIAFEAGEIVAARTDATSTRTITDSGGTVAWAPDGRHVAVVKSQWVGGEPWDPIFTSDIWIVNADGSGGERQLTARGTWNPSRLSWSPDGRTVAVEAQGDLWAVQISTGVVTNLTRTAAITESSPIWSPDGRWLAYGHRTTETGATPQVWLARIGTAHAGQPVGTAGEPTSWR